MEEKKWYVIHTYSGYENKVKANLERRIESMDMENLIFRVLVPMEEKAEVKDGKQKIALKKIFPGYVLVEMIVTDTSWYVVRNTPGVTGFVGSGTNPIPLTDWEIDNILRRMGENEVVAIANFEVGDNIKVTAGPFAGVSGVVEEIYQERAKTKVMVDMFGRATPIELDFSQVEKL